MKKYALAFDLGTGSLKASLYDQDGKSLRSVNVDYVTYHDDNNIHEQNPFNWWKCLVSACRKLTRDFKNTDDIIGIAISGHSLGVVPVDEQGQLLTSRTPIWSDSRGAEFSNYFFSKVDKKTWFYQTGNGFPGGLYPLFKIAWFKKYQPDLYRKTYKFIGTKDYLNMCLCGKIVTDRSYASGSGLYDLKNHNYIKEYADVMDIDLNKFPSIVKSHAVLGTIKKDVAKELGLPISLKIMAGGVDNACMTLGAGCINDGDAYLSLGSSAWVACSANEPSLNFEKTIYAWEHVVEGMYVPSCGIFSAGTSYEWVRELLGNIPHEEVEKLVKQTPVGSNGVIFNPVMAGGSGVDVAVDMKGSWVNFDLSSTIGDMLRSVYEGIAYDLDLAYQALSNNIDIKEPVRAVGGGASSEEWVKIYTNVLGKNIIVSEIKREAATLAAAALVFVGAGIWNDYKKVGELASKGQLIKKNDDIVQQYKNEKQRFIVACQDAAKLYK